MKLLDLFYKNISTFMYLHKDSIKKKIHQAISTYNFQK